MVELRGVEPLSERRPTEASPSAVCDLSLALAAATNSLRLGQTLDLPAGSGSVSGRTAHISDPSRVLWARRGQG